MRYWQKCECGCAQFQVKDWADEDMLFTVHVYYCPKCGAWDVVARKFAHPVAAQAKLLEWWNLPET